MSKLKGARLETEIDKCRSEQNWERLRELITQVSARGSGLEPLVNLLVGEQLLESFVQSFPDFPKPDKHYRDSEPLLKAKEHLTQVKDTHVKPEYLLEAQLLLAKLYYITCHFRDAIDAVNNAGLDKHGVQMQTLRCLKLVAEAYAVKGLSQEHQAAKAINKVQKSHRNEQIFASFEKAADMSIVYLQELDRFLMQSVVPGAASQPPPQGAATLAPAPAGMSAATSGQNLSTMNLVNRQETPKLGRLMETAIQRVVVMLIRKDQKEWIKDMSRKQHHSPTVMHRRSSDAALSPKVVEENGYCSGSSGSRGAELIIPPTIATFSSADCLRRGLERYRQFLRLVDRKPSQQLQGTLARQLAELLLRGVPNESYFPPMFSSNQPPSSSFSGGGAFSATSGPAISPPGSIGLRQFLEHQQQKEFTFVPQNRYEEILLALLISDSIAIREAVLSRHPEHCDLRDSSLKVVSSSQNLITFLLCVLSEYDILVDVLERAMKFAFNHLYLWFQFALALACQGSYVRSLQFFRKCIEISKFEPPLESATEADESETSNGVTGAFTRLLKKVMHEDSVDGLGSSNIFRRKSSASPVQPSQTFSADQCNTAMTHLFAAKQCIEHLGLFEEGILLAEKALVLCHGSWLASRAYLLLGLAHSLMAQTLPTYVERKATQLEAVEIFQNAIRCDPQDHLSQFFLALQYAINRNIDAAKKHCELALSIYPDHAAAILLMGLLLTSDQSLIEAGDLVKEALEEYPNHFGLLVLKLKLECRLGKSDKALSTAKDLLLFWKKGVASKTSSASYRSNVTENAARDSKDTQPSVPARRGASSERQVAASVKHTSAGAVGSMGEDQSIRTSRPSDYADKDSASVLGAPTEFGFGTSSFSESLGQTASTQRSALYALWRLQANIWLELAELFLDAGRLDDVEFCVDEALATFPSSYQALYVKGRIRQEQQMLVEAKTCFLGALSIYPAHAPSMRQLAILYHTEGNVHMAEKTLRDLVKMDPLDHVAWYTLGQLLADLGDPIQSADCLMMATTLQQMTPLLPFTLIPRVMNL